MATTSNNLVFHIAVATNPTKISHLLKVLHDADEPVFERELLDQMALEQSSDSNRFDEARTLAEQLGLIELRKEGLCLTSTAEILLTKRSSVQYDLLHYAFYDAWKPEKPTKHARSWFYRSTCDILWEKQQVRLDLDMRNSLTEQLTSQAIEDFQHLPGFSADKLSLGRQTMAGTLTWLRQLKPIVMEGEKVDEFHRRQACSAELFLLALGRSYQLSDAEVGVDLLLSPQRRNEICQLCLLDPLQFDRMLDWVLPMFPQFMSQGTRSGSYGRFVRLNHLVRIEDLA